MRHLLRIGFLSLLLWLAAFFAPPAEAQPQVWVGRRTQGELHYVFFPSRVERLHLPTRTWLSPIPTPALRGSVTAGWVDADGLYLAYGTALFRYALDGSNETHLLNFSLAVGVGGVLSNATHVFAISGSSITSFRKSDNGVVDQKTFSYGYLGPTISRKKNAIFARSGSVSPADIHRTTINANGTLGLQADSPYHGTYPSASRTWMFPDEARVVDSAGYIYSTSGLYFLGRLGAGIADLSFVGGDVPIVLFSNRVTAYTSAFVPTGATSVAADVRGIEVAGNDLLTFAADSASPNGVRLETIPLLSLNTATPDLPVDPRGVAYTPDGVWLGSDGQVLILSKAFQSVFRWNPQTQQYGPSIPLSDVPSAGTYSATLNRLYLAYEGGLVRRIDLGGQASNETDFTTLAATGFGLKAVDSYLFAADAYNIQTHSGSGALITRKAHSYSNLSSTFVWNAAQQRLYFSAYTQLASVQLNASGSAYPGVPAGGLGNFAQIYTNIYSTNPISVSSSGSTVQTSSGTLYSGANFAQLTPVLGNSVLEGAWVGERLRTIRSANGGTQFQTWEGATFGAGPSLQIPGTPHGLTALDATRLLGITRDGLGVPSFYLFDGDLNVAPPTVIATPSRLNGAIISATQIALSWDDVSGETSYSVERSLDGGAWSQIGTTGLGVTTVTDTGLPAGAIPSYRVIARNGAQASAPSTPLLIILAAPATPAGFFASREDYAVTLSWSDVQFETGYVLEYKSTTSTSGWSPLATLGVNITNFRHENVGSQYSYEYRIKATNGLGTSAYALVSSLGIPPLPTTPYLSVNSLGPYSASFSFYANYAETYVLQRRPDGFSDWFTVASAATSYLYTDLGLLPNQYYQYRAKSVNATGESDWSSIISITTNAPPPPGQPTGLLARTQGPNAIVLTWTDSPDETSYLVFRASEGVTRTQIASLPANTVSFVDPGLMTGVEYVYYLVARNNAGDSLYSASASAVPFLITPLFVETFDPDLKDNLWPAISGGLVLNAGQGFGGSNVLWFGASSARACTTVPLPISQGGYLQFRFRMGNLAADGAAYWDNAESGEEVVLEYSNDGGWSILQTLPLVGAWTQFDIAIPPAAHGPETRFRWRQRAHSGPAFDTWALDDIRILSAPPPVPAPPSFVIAGTVSDRTLAVSWESSSGAAEYRIQRANGANGPWAEVGTAGPGANHFSDGNCVAATWYAYRIVAANVSGAAAPSVVTWARTYSQLENWRLLYYGTTEPTGAAAPTATDADGLANLLKFAFNLPVGQAGYPLTAGSGTAGLPTMWRDPVSGRPQLEFVRRRIDFNPGVSYQVEFSTGLAGSWSSNATMVSRVVLDATWERLRFEPADPSPALFGRVRVNVE